VCFIVKTLINDIPRYNMLENIRRNNGVHLKLRDTGYIYKNNSIRIKKEAQNKAVKKDDDKIR
jgi:hypothetical protein